MKIEKLKIENESIDINLKFYFMLKHIVKGKLSTKQSLVFLEKFALLGSENYEIVLNQFFEYIESFKGKDKKNVLFGILETIESKTDLDLFIFSLKLYLIKDLLLQEAKLTNVVNVSKLEELDPLSLDYDKISVYLPYATRVNGALLALLFFSKLERKEVNFMSEDSYKFIEKLSEFAIDLKNKGVEPNQIFMLMFSESINQSIISDSGGDYEDRIFSVLTKIGIPEDKIKKVHDKDDSSTEFDFFFEIENKTYGIGAKRTLRERYKQFIKTAQMSQIDVMIEITLGLDLNEEKAKSIRNHGVYIFVADEIYKMRKFLQEMEGVFSVRDLTMKTLNEIN
jgi:hypothetical protein